MVTIAKADPMVTGDGMRKALLAADSRLSWYDPLERILMFDRFDRGMHGWQTYFPDYDGWDDYPGRYAPVEPLRQILEKSRLDASLRVDRKLPTGPHGLPMLSSSGPQGGTLKVSTLPRAGDKAFAQKRLGSIWRGKFRVELRFAFQAEASSFATAQTDVSAWFLTFDVMDTPLLGQQPARRWWPALRYLNAGGGTLVQKWQYNNGSKGVKDGPWQDVPEGEQALGAHPAGGVPPWHSLRYTFDLARHEMTDLACDSREFAVGGLRHEPQPPLEGWRASTEKCPGLIGAGLGIEAAVDKRCFLFVDSLLVSASPV